MSTRPAAALLSRLLDQPLDVETYAWARYERIDLVAQVLLASPADERTADAVDEHRRFISWGRANLDADRWLWLVGDSTMATTWTAAGRGHEWLDLLLSALDETPRTVSNRPDRVHACWNLVGRHLERDRLGDAQRAVDEARRIAEEDPAWDEAVSTLAQCLVFEIPIHAKRGDVAALRDAAVRAAALVQDRGAPAGVVQMAGCMLADAGEYDLAIELFRRYIALREEDHWMYLRLASAVWVTTRDKPATVDLLRHSARLAPAGDALWQFRNLPEFAEQTDDEAFIEAITSARPA